MPKILLSLMALSLISLNAQARCVNGDETVTLTGVLTKSAAYVDPKVSGSVPRNGFVPYVVLVINDPVCLNDEGEVSSNVRVLQFAGGSAVPSAEALAKGVPVRVTGTLFREHTVHHHTEVLINAEELTTLR